MARFADRAIYEWDDWAAGVVRAVKGPIEINLLNATSSVIPVVDIGIAGHFCQKTCLAPGKRTTCRPEFGQASPIFLQFGRADEAFPNIMHAPVEQIPVSVTWRSHGSVELTVTDAGIEVRGAFREAFGD